MNRNENRLLEKDKKFIFGCIVFVLLVVFFIIGLVYGIPGQLVFGIALALISCTGIFDKGVEAVWGTDTRERKEQKKYKGAVVQEGQDNEVELSVSLEITKHFIDKEEQEQYVKELMNSIQKVCVRYPREIHVERVQECVLRVSGEAFTFDWDGNTVLADVYDLMSLLTFAGLKVRVGVHMRLEDGFVCDDLITLDEYWDNLE